VRQRKELSHPAVAARPFADALVPSPLIHIPVRPLEDDPNGRILFLAPMQVSYFFRGSAVRQELIQANGIPLPAVADDGVYVRTIKGSVYRAVWRSLAEVAGELGEHFFSVHQSLLVNVNLVVDAYLRADPHRVGLRVAPQADYLAVARRQVTALRQRLFGRVSGA
jgi:hypothetical protein